MPDILLGLASAVIKTALKIWLKDEALAADASAPVVDLVISKVNGDLEQRRARRFFEDLEVPIEGRLRTLRNTEFKGLPDNEWNAAVLAAHDSFDHTRLTAKDLFTSDLDPLSLEQRLRAGTRDATRDLAAGGVALYDRLISEGCAHVIEIADKLPQFDVGAFSELLRRDRQILERIEEVLRRIPGKTVGESERARFETACRRHLATRLDRLELFGLDFESRWYPLSVAYVSLRVEGGFSAGGQAIEDQLEANRRTLLLGRAGSGKTTVLQWLAVRAARSSFTGSLGRLNDHFPFFVRLREYVGRALPQPEELLTTTAPLLVAEAPEGWARARLRSGQALVLIDGVDELPEGERSNVRNWLCEFTELFPHARYVITGRPTAVESSWLEDIGFTHCSLDSMPPSLVRSFIRHWYEAARDQVTDKIEQERLISYEESLLVNVTKDRYLRDLADTPLLAGLLCALNLHMRSHLPRRRTEIYERAIGMFDQRDRARGIASAEAGLDLAAKTHVLADVALWMLRNGESEIDDYTAKEEISRSIERLSNIKESPDGVFQLLLERSGVLREPGVGHIDFIHRTFQEYLAAKAAVDGNSIGELVRNAGNDQWGETVVLAAGQGNQTQAEKLLQGLIRRSWHGDQRYRRRILAVACLREVGSLDPSMRSAVESVVPSMLPPRSTEQAERLTSLEGLLIPMLGQYWERDPKMAPHTIRAASLIGGADAMEIIRSVVLHPQSHFGNSDLVRAWQYFETDEYAKSVLTAAGVEEFEVENARQLRALPMVPSIRGLTLNTSLDRWAMDLNFLSKIYGLQHLELILSGGFLGSLTGLEECALLTTLSISDYPSEDLAFLPTLPQLKWLAVESRRLTDLVGIERQSSVVKVELHDCINVTSLRQLLALPRLEEICFYGYANLAGLESNRRSLRLILRRCGNVDLTALAGTRHLEIFYDGSTRLIHPEALPKDSSAQTLGDTDA